MKKEIKTYSTEAFRERFMKAEPRLDSLLKADFDTFFIVRVEEMIRLMKLPVPPTRSTSHTFIYLTAGEAVMSIGSETYTIYQNEGLFVPAGQVFSFSNADINQGYLCHFHHDFAVGKFGSPEGLNAFEFLKVWGNLRVRFDPITAQYVVHGLARMLTEYSEHGLRRVDLLRAYWVALLYEVDGVYEPPSLDSRSRSVSLTHRFRELLVANVTTHHRVTDYAAALNITPNHLNKVVKQTTGKSPTRWIDEALVIEAKVLLYQTDFTIGEVAAEVGISDPSYFSRLFKKYEGITPLQFRHRIKTF